MQTSKKKKSTFKNPFDLDIDSQEQTSPVTTKTKNQNFNVINPLPFNPYVIENQNKTNNNKNTNTSQIIYENDDNASGKKGSQKQTYQNRYQSEQSQIKHERIYEPSELNQDGDPPLLQDIGIDPKMIKKRAFIVLKMKKPDEQTIQQSDLSGPILIALCFGMLLLLSGKVHFGDIYAIFVLGNILLFFLFNFMSQIETISLYNIMSTMGYSMIPMLILGFMGIFITMKGPLGIILSLVVAGWSSYAASNFIEGIMKQTESNRKALLIYPLFLFYVCFAMIIIF